MRKKKKKLLVIFVLLLIIGGLVYATMTIVDTLNYRQTYEYKLTEHGYTIEEANALEEFFEEKYLDNLLTREANQNILTLIEDPYFMFDKLDRYLVEKEINGDRSLRDVIATVNSEADQDFYSNVQKTNVDHDDQYLILVNKFNKLPEDFEPGEIESIGSMYAYADRYIESYVYERFREMWHAASQEDLTLIITSGYRDYETQERIYSSYLATRGKDAADRISARPGHSEHQLGYAVDIVTHGYGLVVEFEESDEFAWLVDNAHRFGFILRYPDDAEHITGYLYEPWHYRYVGEEVATYIYENQITYDEYYNFYIK